MDNKITIDTSFATRDITLDVIYNITEYVLCIDTTDVTYFGITISTRAISMNSLQEICYE